MSYIGCRRVGLQLHVLQNPLTPSRPPRSHTSACPCTTIEWLRIHVMPAPLGSQPASVPGLVPSPNLSAHHTENGGPSQPRVCKQLNHCLPERGQPKLGRARFEPARGTRSQAMMYGGVTDVSSFCRPLLHLPRPFVTFPDCLMKYDWP